MRERLGFGNWVGARARKGKFWFFGLKMGKNSKQVKKKKKKKPPKLVLIKC